LATRESQTVDAAVPLEGPARARRRATFLEWCTLLGIIAVVGGLLGPGVERYFREHGLPGWCRAYLRWEARHLPIVSRLIDKD
jgi:hypothetical protein